MTGPRVQVHAADMGGCGHYRLIWPASALYYAGADVDLITPHDAGATFDCRIDPFASVANDRLMLSGLNRRPDADVVVLQRPLTRQLVDVIRFLQAAGVAVVVEVDDDFETIDPENIAWRTVHPRHNPERNWSHLAEACRLADLVTVTTPALAARYGRHGRVAIIPNLVPAGYLHVMTEEHDGVRVGWSGNIDTHPRDLQVTRGAVARVLRRHGLNFHLVGSGRVERPNAAGEMEEVLDYRLIRNLGLAGEQTFAHTGGWLPLEKYPKAMAELDVGIVPLADTAFNQAKSWLKGLEFAAVGRPFVASPSGPYMELHAAGIGRLAGRPRDWERELDRLIVDGDYRAEVGENHRRAVARSFVIENNLERWLDAWHLAAEHAAARRKVAT